MNLDPNDFDVTPIAVVDEFKMSDDDGTVIATVDKKFLSVVVARMQEREQGTGDLSPIVIGHTSDGLTEVDQPQIVGYARNWRVAPLYNTGRDAAWCDAWVFKTNRVLINGKEVLLSAKDIAQRWPRRSAEVWPRRKEIDPISLLGATTPARDLGLMKLSRDGSIVYYSPQGEDTVNPQSPAIDAAAAAQSAPWEQLNSTMQQILAVLTKMSNPAPEQAAPDAAAQGAPPGAQGAPGDDQLGDISDEELAALLGGGDAQGAPDADQDDESRKKDKPVQNSGMGYPGGSNTHVNDAQVRLSAVETELAATRTQLARLQLQRSLSDIRETGVDVDPNDDALVSDLAAMPPDIRERQIGRIKLQRKAPVKDSFNLESAVQNSTDGSRKRIQTKDEQTAVIKLAREDKITFEAAAGKLGYSV